MVDAECVEGERQLLEPVEQVAADQLRGLGLRDVQVVSRLGLGRRREDRLRQAIGLDQAGRQRDAADLAGRLVVLPSRARQVAARDALDGERRRPAHEHRAPVERRRVPGRRRRKVGARRCSSTWLSTMWRVRSNQNADNCVSTRPLSGMPDPST